MVSIRRTDLCAFEPQPLGSRAILGASFNPSNGFVCLRTMRAPITWAKPSLFQSVERICVPSNGDWKREPFDFHPGFNPSNGFVCLRTWYSAGRSPPISESFQSVERICVPSNSRARPDHQLGRDVSIRRTDLCAFELAWGLQRGQQKKVSIRRTDLCAFERLARGLCRLAADVSIRRTDLCAFELRILVPSCLRVSAVSIRRTDLCAFEPAVAVRELTGGDVFQSVERICVPSNYVARFVELVEACFNPSNGFVCLRTFWRARAKIRPILVSIRRTDLCAFERTTRILYCTVQPLGFNPSNGFVCLRTTSSTTRPEESVVSIRRTDLCAFEPHGQRVIDCTSFVSIRRTDLCAFERTPHPNEKERSIMFQSVERICVPSNYFLDGAKHLKSLSFNPSNGFVCLRTIRRHSGLR